MPGTCRLASLHRPEDELVRLSAYIASIEPLWEPPGDQTAGIGHNSLPQTEGWRLLSEFADQIKGVVFAEYSATQKLVTLAIRLHADNKTLDGAYPSYATLMRAASVKDGRTVSKEVGALVKEGLLDRQYRDGQSPIYGISKRKA